MRSRLVAVLLMLACLACAACGGGVPKANSADLLAINQPTPDPTLDAVVRDLPHALAGIPPTPTPTPIPARVVPAPKPPVKQAPTPVPTVRKPAPTPTAARH